MTKDILRTLRAICPGWDREVRFCERKFSFDFGNHIYKIAIELEGGVYSKSGHAATSTYLKDMVKYNLAQIKGWLLLRYTPSQTYTHLDQIKSDVKNALKLREKQGIKVEYTMNLLKRENNEPTEG